MDEQLYRLQFERADLLKRIDEDQDDLNDLMQKHKDLIAQVMTETRRRQGAVGRVGGRCCEGLWLGHSSLSKDLGGINATMINGDVTFHGVLLEEDVTLRWACITGRHHHTGKL